MKKYCAKNYIRSHTQKPLAKAINRAIALKPILPKTAGGLFLIGYMGFNLPASALNVSDLNGSNGFVITGEGVGPVHTIGDINADGNADFITGDNVVFGRSDGSFPATLNTNLLDGSNGFKFNGSYSASLDMNGDGIDDIALFASNSGSDDANVIFGRNQAIDGPFPATISTTDLNGSNGFRINPPSNGAEFSSLGTTEDISGDGIDDLVLLSERYVGTRYTNQTYIHVVFGRDPITAFPVSFPLADINGVNGFRMTINRDLDQSIGLVGQKIDFNGDSFNDILTHNSFYALPFDHGHATRAILASKLGTNSIFPSNTNISYDSDIRINAGGFVVAYGSAQTSIAGDLDNDGTGDVALCCKTYSGQALITFGGVETDGETPGEKSITISQGYSTESLNIGSAHSMGDINDDGLDDLLLAGASVYHSGNTDRSLRHYILFGRDVLSQGDFPDNIAAPYFDGQNGFSFLDETHTLGEYESRIHKSANGDINGDGINDIVIATAIHDGPSVDAGRTNIVFGSNAPFLAEISSSNLSSQQGFVIDGAAANHKLGSSIAISDVNNDGLDDVILGSANDAYVIFGSPVQSTKPIAVCPGDINGNGEADFAVLSQGNDNVSVAIKDIDGNLISTIQYTTNNPVVDLEVMADFNRNGAPELVVLGGNPTTGEVRDSLTGQLLGSVNVNSVSGLIDLEILPDQNSNGVAELASLDLASRVKVNDPLSSTLIRSVQFNSNFIPIDLSVLDRTPPRLAVLMDKEQINKTDKVEIRHLNTGAVLKNLYYGKGWSVKQLELLADINGNGRQEAAVLREKTNRFDVMIRDSQSGNSLGVLGYDSNYSPIKFSISEDLNNNGFDEIVMLDKHKLNGTIKATVKDSKNRKLIKKMFYNKNLIMHDLDICPDLNGNNKPEVVVLGERMHNGDLVLVIKDAKTGQRVGSIDF